MRTEYGLASKGNKIKIVGEGKRGKEEEDSK